jgi:hypothetical protein
MDKCQIESIPELNSLITFLHKNNLDEIVFKVLGGLPTDYIKLQTAITDSNIDIMKIELIRIFLKRILLDAYELIIENSQNTTEIINLFREKNVAEFLLADLKSQNLLLDYPNKVFRKVRRNNDIFIVPAKPSIGMIITNKIVKGADIITMLNQMISNEVNKFGNE